MDVSIQQAILGIPRVPAHSLGLVTFFLVATDTHTEASLIILSKERVSGHNYSATIAKAMLLVLITDV